MSKTFELDHLINELSVADQVLQTLDKAQKPDPVVEQVVVEKVVNIESVNINGASGIIVNTKEGAVRLTDIAEIA